MPRRNRKKSSSRSSRRRNTPKKALKNRSKPELILKTKFSPNLSWMYPYLRKAKRKMPNLILPRQVRSYKPNKSRIMRTLGNVYFSNRTIIISTHNQLTFLNRRGHLRIKRILRLPRAQMLDTLAHEIAHFHYPDHGYEHEEFSRAIFKTFELKENCPYCKGSGKVIMEGKY